MRFPQRLCMVLLIILVGVGGCQPYAAPASEPVTKTGLPEMQQTTLPAAILVTGQESTPAPAGQALSSQPSEAQAAGAQVNAPITAPLFVNPDNRRYFTNGAMVNGKYQAVYLSGSHTWCNLIDCGGTNPPVTFNYTAFLDFMTARHYNFFRLWRAENARGGEAGPNFWFDPMPYQRSTTCCAFDGGNKFDLTKFNQAYFDRLRARVVAAGQRGIYVSVMLFDGWSVESKFGGHDPWAGHPYKASNNINGISGDVNGNGSGEETHIQTGTPITALQEAYVKKVIDTVNDLDNVLYEISNESPGDNPSTTQADGSKAWQYSMINLIKTYEAGKPKRHPVGMTWEWPYGNNQTYYDSPADWISLGGASDLATYQSPVTSGALNSKIVLADTDHLCGICGDGKWVWKSFTRGENPIFMDIYDNATSGRGMPFTNPNEAQIRQNMTYALDYAYRINLAAMTPQPALCSTGYCLAYPAASGAQYLVYLPSAGTASVNLTGSQGTLAVEWFNPASGLTLTAGTVAAGTTQNFTAPFTGSAVLYLYAVSAAATSTATTAPTATRTPTPIPGVPTQTPAVVPSATRTATTAATANAPVIRPRIYVPFIIFRGNRN